MSILSSSIYSHPLTVRFSNSLEKSSNRIIPIDVGNKRKSLPIHGRIIAYEINTVPVRDNVGTDMLSTDSA